MYKIKLILLCNYCVEGLIYSCKDFSQEGYWFTGNRCKRNIICMHLKMMRC